MGKMYAVTGGGGFTKSNTRVKLFPGPGRVDTFLACAYAAFFGQFHTSLRKDSVANYASIWTLFSTFVTGPNVLCNALNISQICL